MDYFKNLTEFFADAPEYSNRQLLVKFACSTFASNLKVSLWYCPKTQGSEQVYYLESVLLPVPCRNPCMAIKSLQNPDRCAILKKMSVMEWTPLKTSGFRGCACISSVYQPPLMQRIYETCSEMAVSDQAY